MIGNIISVLNRLEEYLLGCIILAMAGIVTVQVFTRWFGIGFSWVDETGRQVLILVTFVGASMGVKRGLHFAMTALQEGGSPLTRHILKAITNLACALFFLIIIYHGFAYVLHLKKLGVTTATLGLPRYIPYLPIPLFSIGISLRFFLIFIKEFRSALFL
jgi:C4-dicarboxylate transporter DctQ subunit